MNDNNILMSLDQATKDCGYAVFNMDTEELLEYGVFQSDHEEKNVTTRIEQIYIQIYDKSQNMNVKYFVFEDTFNKLNIQVTKNLCWLQGAIMQMAFVNDYGFLMYYPKSWRKILGFRTKSKGKNPQPNFKNNREYQKYQAIEYINNKYNLDLKYKVPTNDDIAEAICIGLSYFKDIK